MERNFHLPIETPVTIREKVYKAIRDEILNGYISPGSRLVETRLAQQIKTSRTPVREALHLLEREGLLESIPRVGYRVRQIKWDEVEEICEIRAVNEELAARWAMRRITPEELKALERNLAESERVAGSDHPGGLVERDAEFHEILVRASGSERLVELCDQLRRHMLLYRIESLYLAETAMTTIEGHRRIFECIQRKDSKGIGKAIRSHLKFVKWAVQRYAFQEKGKEAGSRKAES